MSKEDLFQINDAEKHHDTRYFAMLHNAAAIGGNKLLEGGQNKDALAYYNYLLNLEIPNCPISFQLSSKQLSAVKTQITNLININTFIESNDLTNSTLSQNNLINQIKDCCQQHGSCYLPSGYKGESGGHFAALKIRATSGARYALSVINHGDGIRYHRVISMSGSKDKPSYQSNEYEIDLTSKNGRELLQKILELNLKPLAEKDKENILNPYSADDLYGLLKLYGNEIPLEDKISEKSVTPQRTGTCTVTNIHATARDILIDNNADHKTRKHYHFVIKLRSLIDGFNAYCEGRNSHASLEWALKEFSVRVNKYKANILSDEEIIYCEQLHTQIQQRLDQDKKIIIQKKCEPKPFPPVTGEAPQHAPTIIDLSRIRESEKPHHFTDKIELPSTNKIRPNDIVKLIKFESRDQYGKEQPLNLQNMYKLFNALPHCTGLTKDPFWNKVPQRDIGPIIFNLAQIAEQLKSNSEDSSLSRSRTFALSLMIYDITAQLAPLYKSSSYGGFKLSDKFAFGLDDVYSEQCFYTDPTAYYTIKRIAKNFAQRGQSKQRVFTNAVNYDNKYDNTIHYVIRILLDDNQRKAIAQARMQEEKKDNAQYSDNDLFDYLTKHLSLSYTKPGGWDVSILDPTVIHFIKLAATAHALGNYTNTYSKKENKELWSFKENRFHREIDRQEELENTEIAKHLPTVKKNSPHDSHQDFSENTIYRHENLEKLQHDFINSHRDWLANSSVYSPKAKLQPYQLYLSGSLHPDSTIWHPDSKQLVLYEELNEDLRHIECSPNLQVIRTFAWATTNVDKLKLPEIRTRIHELLFQYGKLDSALANQLEPTLYNMNCFLTALHKYCAEEAQNNIELSLWAANLAYDLRYYAEVAAKLYNLPIKNFSLPSFRELLLIHIQNNQDTATKSALANHIVKEFRNSSPLSIENSCLILISRMLANLNEADSSNEIWESLHDEIFITLTKEKHNLSKVLNPLLSTYFKFDANQHWQLSDSHLQTSNSDFYIDLRTGSLQKSGIKKPKDRTAKTITENKDLFEQLNLTTDNITLFYSGENQSHNIPLKSSNDKWEFICNQNYKHDGYQFEVKETFQHISIEKNSTKFKLLNKEEISKLFDNKNPFESDSYCNSNYLYWQSVDQPDLFFVQQIKHPNIAYYGFIDNEMILMTEDTVKIYSGKGNELQFDLMDGWKTLKEISERNNNAPILIQQYYGMKYSLFGFFDNTWKITELSSHLDRDDKYKIFDNLPFDYGKWTTVKSKSLSAEIHEIIAIKQAHTSPKDQGIRQLVCDNTVNWQHNNQILFNLIEPKTELEQLWANRLAPMFGVQNIRCTATLNDEKTTCTLTRIEHLLLGLNFVVNDKDQLACTEMPGYFIAQDISIKSLNGLPSVIVLQNDKDEKKYVLPIFSLNKGENNNALNYEDIINYNDLCHKSPPHYYTYTLNANNELVGESVESNLYLAILYRSQGNFKQAITYLERCKTYKNINAATAAIAMQALTRIMKSPMGAAFDLKLEYYLKTHQAKWSKDDEQRFEPAKLTDEWQKWITAQLQFYNSTYSYYKKDIAILPIYCRLTEDELKFYHPSGSPKILELNNRLKTASQLPNIITNYDDADGWRKHVESNYKLKMFPSYEFSTHRFYEDEKNPAFSYLRRHFGTLLADAISTDEKTRLDKLKQLYKKLFSLLQNDKDPIPETYELVSLLLFASKYSEFFKDFIIPSMTIEAIIETGNVFQKNVTTFRNKSAHLFDNQQNFDLIDFGKTLPSDFSPDPIKFVLDNIRYEQECKKPLSHLVDFYFTRTEAFVAKTDFKLELSGLPNANLLEKRLFEHYQQGHIENQTKKKTIYKAIDGCQLKDLKHALVSHKEDDESLLAKLADDLLSKANKTPLTNTNATEADKAKAANLLMAHHGEQKTPITVSDLLTAFLQRDATLLTSQNPFLSQTDANNLFAELANYSLISSRITQTNEVLRIIADKKQFSDIESYELQLIASTLDKTRAYDIKDYPEFLMYEYESQRLLRKDQVDILIKLINLIENDPDNHTEMRHGLLQFAAGGGKTSVLIPILAQRFASKGFLPVIFNTNELYDIGIEEIPKNLRFKQNIEVIERDLDHIWTAKELAKLLKDLEQWRKERKCLLIKATTWHSINITMKWGHFKYQPELAQAAQAVLDFFKTKSVKLEDESHIVSNPMLQSIKTLGSMHNIPDKQLDLLLRSYDFLMGYEKNSSDISKLAGIKSNRKRSISPEELTQLQKKLADVIAREEVFTGIPHEQLVTYLLQPEKSRPDWLRELSYSWNKTDADAKRDNELANLVVLARAFIKTHLPHILSLQYKKDYGQSINKGDLTAAPKHESKDVTAHFGDHTLVIALSIQLYSQRGLLSLHVEKLLDHLIKEHKEERQWNHNLNVPTLAEHWLMQHIPEQYLFSSYRDLNADLIAKLSKDEQFFKNSAVIEKFLLTFVLPQIKIPAERITSTAAELQAGFNRSLLFSATPGLPETYPAFLKPENCFLEAAFEAQVIDTLLDAKNDNICVLKKSQTPTDFFKQFPSDLLTKMTTLIDRGALLTDFDAKEIIDTYLALDPKEHPIASQRASFFFKKNGKEFMHLRSNDPNIKEDNNISGSSLIAALKKQGIKPEKFLLFLFLDLSKTTGTDIKRPYNDHAGLTVGKNQTASETFQAAMRERQLLEDDAQSISWLMFQSIYKEINPNDNEIFDPRQIFYWLIKNEANDIEDKIIQRAYQGIDQAIKAIAWQESNNDPKSFISLNGFASELREKQDANPFYLYEQEAIEKDATWVLHDYKDKLLERFQFEKRNIAVPKETLDHIEKIILETAALIARLQTPPKTQLGTEVQQEMYIQANEEQEQQQEQRIKTKLDTATDFVFELEKYNIAQDNLDNIFNNASAHYQAIQLAECDGIKQPEILFSAKHFSVTQQKLDENNQRLEQLKPIKMLLVKILPDHTMKFLACTAAGEEHYTSLINNQIFTKNDPSYALITIDGGILHTSNNFSFSHCQQLIDTERCQKMMTYAHFLNGKANNPVILSQIIQEQCWSKESYTTLVNAITAIHVGQSPVALLNNRALEKLCGWDKKLYQAPKINTQRYYPPVERQNKSILQQNLRPVSALDNHMETSPFPIISPQRALEGYVFGDTPRPVSEITEDLQLNAAIKNIKSFYNNNNIKEKDTAIAKLHDSATKIINSLLDKKDKIKKLDVLYIEFKIFDAFLEKLHIKLDKYNDTAVYLENLKEVAINAVSYAYMNYAKGEQLDECKIELKTLLENIAQETDAQYKSHHNNNSRPTQLFFKYVLDCRLTSILMEAKVELEKSVVSHEAINEPLALTSSN